MNSMVGDRLRRGSLADVALLNAIERDAAELYREVGYDFCADGPLRERDEYARGLRHGTLLLLEPAAADAAVAFALVWRVDGRAHLTELAVRQAWQGQGIGRRLIAEVEDWAAAAGYDELTLTTFRDGSWNAPYYERLGFRRLKVDGSRPELLAIRRDEAAWGFDRWPRLAMAKRL